MFQTKTIIFFTWCELADLRNQLKVADNFARLQAVPLSEKSARYVADVAVAIPTPEAGSFLLSHIQKYSEETPELKKYLRHVSRIFPNRRWVSCRASHGRSLLKILICSSPYSNRSKKGRLSAV